ncbi:protein male-specific lethal-1-like [Uranotaenia lowii]|uniref:protein male-specific lethal-1-like n=1 Tax=Uranotaenia lowii TaxID=190385 RepID=UPI002478C6B9|nr:protein male-specific lethal-1-like [Uranotaenia lowii]
MMMENLDHVYCNTASTDVGGKDTSEQMSLFKEVKQLQSILLLHLDLIQEQSDQILAKDKLIIKLKDENEMLKHQLELVNKQLQQMKQREQQREISNPIRNITFDKIYDYENSIASRMVSEQIGRAREPSVSGSVANIKKEVISSDYDHFDSMCADFDGDLESDIKIENNEIEEEIFLNYSKSDDESVPSNDVPVIDIRSAVELRPPSSSTPISCGVGISQPLDEMVNNAPSDNYGACTTTNTNNKNNSSANGVSISSDNIEKARSSSVDCEPAKDVIFISEEVGKAGSYNPTCSSGNSSDGSFMKKSYKAKYITTNKEYITCNWKDEAITNDIERLMENEAAELEIPCWTVIDENLEASRSSSDLVTENISDEAYMKRHAKLELDERRRKKWDVQRIREQKMVERLKKRHLKAEAEEQKIISSFYPSIDSIKYVQIIEDIPVQAFGELIPDLHPSNFSLPWMRMSIETTETITPPEFGPGPLFNSSTNDGLSATPSSSSSSLLNTQPSAGNSSSSSSQEQKTKFLHRLAPNLIAQKQRFTKRIKKEN